MLIIIELYFSSVIFVFFGEDVIAMELLEQRIAEQGKVIGSDIIKVDMFLNHQIDVGLLCEIGKEFRRLFAASNINKIVR